MKELRRRSDDPQLLGIGHAGQHRAPIRVGRECFDQLASLAPGEQARVRRDVPLARLARIGHPDHDRALGLAVGQRIDEQGLANAEHGGRQRDAERDGTDRHGREPSLATDQTKGESKILRQHQRVLFGSVREDRGNSAQEHDDSRGRIVLAAEPVDQDERHLPPVFVAV